MKSSVTSLEENKVKVSVDIDETEIDTAIEAAFKKIAKEVRLPGFRPGKAPRKVLEARLGKDYARGEALNEAIPEYYRKAVIEHDVDVISSPDLELVAGQEDGPVSFEAVVEVRPVIVVAGYDGLRIEVPAPVASDEEVEEMLEGLRSQFAERQEVDRPAIDGDFVIMHIEGFEDGEPNEGLTADDYTYEVGSGFILDEMDENIRGAKVGDAIEFSGTHPSDDDVELSFKVLVKKVEEKVLPELTDEFVAEATEFDTAEALLADTRNRIVTMKKDQAEHMIAGKTGDALAELVDVEIPDALVQDQVQNQIQDMAMRLAQQGIGFEQFLEITGQGVEDLTANMQEPALQAAKVDLALRAVAAAEGMEITDDEFHAELERTAEQLGSEASVLLAGLVENGQITGLKADMLKQKAMDHLLEIVEIVDEDGNPVDRADLAAAHEALHDGSTADEGAMGDTGNSDSGDDVAEDPTDTGDVAEGDNE